MSNLGAYLLRETTGTNHVAETLHRAVEILAHWDIPHWVVDGLAVQEHGYYRVTTDVDIVVPDVLEAYEFLTADLTGPFERVPEQEGRLRDRTNDVLVDLLPARRVLQRGCPGQTHLKNEIRARELFAREEGLGKFCLVLFRSVLK